MNWRGFVVLLAGLAVAAFLVALIVRPTGPRTPQSQGEIESHEKEVAQNPISLGPAGLEFAATVGPTGKRSDSEKFVSLSQITTDTNYVKSLIRKHLSIRSYLASPANGHPEFEQVIDWLIGNGYSIEDTVIAWSALGVASSMQSIEDVRERMQRDGKSPEQIERSAEAILAASRQNDRAIIAAWMQIGKDEVDILDSFLALEPLRRQLSIPVNRIMPEVPPVEGEAILTDEDWMTQARKDLVAQYRGPRRSTDPRPDWRSSPSPLTNTSP